MSPLDLLTAKAELSDRASRLPSACAADMVRLIAAVGSDTAQSDSRLSRLCLELALVELDQTLTRLECRHDARTH